MKSSFFYAGHVSRRRFAQNFLVDKSVISAILAEIDPQKNDFICEIGPGLGALTHHLADVILGGNFSLDGGQAKSDFGRMVVIEIDRDLVRRLRETYGTNLEIFCCDVLQFDFAKLCPSLISARAGTKFRIVGNLPYNISTPILFFLQDSIDFVVDQHFLLQKEVIDRIVAKPGTKSYGRLSVILQYQYYLEKVFDVSPSAFKPRPKVTSSIIRMIPKPSVQRNEVSIKNLSFVVNKAFSQRRKKLKNTLSFLERTMSLSDLEVDLSKRAEELTVSEYVGMTKILASVGLFSEVLS